MTAARRYMIQRLWVRLRHPRDATDRVLKRVLGRAWELKTMRIVFSLIESPKTAETGHLALGMVASGFGWERWPGLARAAFNRVSDAALLRYALPEAARALAASDEDADRDRALSLLRAGCERWRKIRSRFSPERRLQLAAASAALGDAETFEFFIAGLPAPEAHKKGLSPEAHKKGLSPGGAQKIMHDPALAQEVDTLKRIFAEQQRAATGEPVWLTVDGSFGREVWPGHCNFPFPGNTRPLFTAFHIANPKFLDHAALAYLKRFAPIGCRDLLTARLLRGAGVKAFASESEAAPQPVLDAIREGQTEAQVRALWRKATAPAMKRTDAMVAEQNAQYPLPIVRLENLGLDRIPVRNFEGGPIGRGKPVHILFSFDENLAEHFPGTFEGIWRHATRPLVVHILGRGLNAAMFERWAAIFEGVRFIWRDLDRFTYGDGLRLMAGTTVSTMDRLLAPALLPNVEKVVYLDVDMLVRADISRLFDIELGDAPLAARRNVVAFTRIGARYLYLCDKLPEDRRETYHNVFFEGPTVFEGFNAGVLVMNLAQMRRERAVEKTLALVRACGTEDQMALNLTTRGRWIPLPPERVALLVTNWFEEDPEIVHFTMTVKPWVEDLPGPFMREWRANAASASRR